MTESIIVFWSALWSNFSSDGSLVTNKFGWRDLAILPEDSVLGVNHGSVLDGNFPFDFAVDKHEHDSEFGFVHYITSSNTRFFVYRKRIGT